MDGNQIKVLSRLGVIEYFIADMYAYLSIQRFGTDAPKHINDLDAALAELTDNLTIPVADPAISMHLSAEIQEAFRAMSVRVRNAVEQKLDAAQDKR